MRRILIIGVILVGAWFVFQELNAPETEEGNTGETVTESVSAEAMLDKEVVVGEEDAKEEVVVEATEEGEERNPIDRTGLSKEEVTTVTPPKSNNTLPIVVSAEAEETIMDSSERPVAYITDTVKVFLYEWGVDLSTATVDAGNIEFQVFNNGQFTHHFGINGESLGKVVPGEWASFTAPLEAGDILISSPRQVDMANEMQETLYVQ